MRSINRFAMACAALLALAPAARAQTGGTLAPSRQCVGCDSAQAASHRAALAERLARTQFELAELHGRLNETQDAGVRRELLARMQRLSSLDMQLQSALQGPGAAAGVRGGSGTSIRYTSVPSGYIGLNLEAPFESRSIAGGWVTRYTKYPDVVSVEPGSPAERAGVRTGDILLSINGMDARNPGFAQQLTESLRPGNQLVMRLRRGESVHTLAAEVDASPTRFHEFTVVQMPAGEGTRVHILTPRGAAVAQAPSLPRPTTAPPPPARPAAGAPPVAVAPPVPMGAAIVSARGRGAVTHVSHLAGAELLAVNQEFARTQGSDRAGLMVLDVGAQTPASRSGLQIGDLIVGLAGADEATVERLAAALRGDGRRGLMLEVLRNRQPMRVTLRW